MRPQDYCRDAAAPPGSSLHYATLFLAPDERRALFALFALLAETDAASRALPDPAVGRAKLHWWVEQLGRRADDRAAHPVLAELAWAAQAAPGLEAELRASVLSLAAFPDAAPRSYDEWVAGHGPGQGRLWALSARRCGASGAQLDTARRIGMLLAAIDDVRHLPLALRAGHCLLPLHEPECAGLSATALSDPAGAEPLAHCLRAILGRIRSELLRAESELAAVRSRPLLYLRIMARLGAVLCVELAADSAQILRRRVALTPLRKLLIALRTRFIA